MLVKYPPETSPWITVFENAVWGGHALLFLMAMYGMLTSHWFHSLYHPACHFLITSL